MPRTTKFPDLTGVDLEGLPPIMTTEQLAPVLRMSADALAQDRYRRDGKGIPFTRIGNRIRYLKADVLGYLIENRSTCS
jgi:hypothetical protein